MTTRIGILSDTHIQANSESFQHSVERAFTGCEIIIHAGDLTDHAILEAFGNRVVHSVHGNMCTMQTRRRLPESLRIRLYGYTIAVCHGAGIRQPLESGLLERFHDADCVIYGHTHQPLIHRFGGILFVNPGSFRPTGRYGHPGDYAILEVGDTTLSARLHTLEADR